MCDSPQAAPAASADAREKPAKRKRAPKRVYTANPQANVNKVERWIGGIACSSVWHGDLVDLFRPRRHPDPAKEDFPPVLTFSGSRKACYRLLNQTRHYPPGGSDTAMHRCLSCGHWCPRNQGEGCSILCIDCYFNDLPPGRWAWLPPSHEMGWKVKLSEVKEFLADGTIRRLRGKAERRDEGGAMFFCGRDYALKLLRWAEGASRSKRRPLYLKNDPRVCGGSIDEDGVMEDPFLGRIELQAVIETREGEVAHAK